MNVNSCSGHASGVCRPGLKQAQWRTDSRWDFLCRRVSDGTFV